MLGPQDLSYKILVQVYIEVGYTDAHEERKT
jgi:hypothetical protein